MHAEGALQQVIDSLGDVNIQAWIGELQDNLAAHSLHRVLKRLQQIRLVVNTPLLRRIERDVIHEL